MLKMKNTKCIIDIHGENFVVNQIVYDYIRELERETIKNGDELIKSMVNREVSPNPFYIENETENNPV